MSANKIQGRAKKYDGAAIDYVSIFNWTDGKCIAQIIPDASGNWQYSYSKNLEVGITYVANGCEPMTHGPYSFTYEYNLFTDTILHYDFDGNVLDGSASNLNGIKTGDANFVTGRKAGTQALEFIAGCVRTPVALPINSRELTVSFWMKFPNGALPSEGMVYETSTNAYDNSGGILGVLDGAGFFQSSLNNSSGYNITRSPISSSPDFYHILITMSNSLSGITTHKIYINNVLTSVMDSVNQKNSSANIGNYILYIGQRAATSLSLKAILQDMRFYNRVLTAEERTQLFNE